MTRHFVVGDIHGCLHELNTQLELVNFDKTTDRLYALGDLIDRGPDSLAVLRLLHEPWFDSVLGNHEDMMLHEPGSHYQNGGAWFSRLDQTEKDECLALARDLPLNRTVTTESGKRYGLVHADWPRRHPWRMYRDDFQRYREYLVWSREGIRDPSFTHVEGVDAVYFGHTPVKQPLRRGNLNWIDTGCFATGILTMEELP
jgi:serine/threonine protein phosphatase 1